jgi:WD40 repeat protein
VQHLKLHTDAVSSVAVCGEGQVCGGGWDGCMYAIDVGPATATSRKSPVKVDEKKVRILSMAASGRVVAVGSADHQVTLYL